MVWHLTGLEKIWSSFRAQKHPATAVSAHTTGNSRTHTQNIQMHTELPQRNHVFQLHSLKEDTAVEHRGREREGGRDRGRERARVVVQAGASEGERGKGGKGQSRIPEDLD